MDPVSHVVFGSSLNRARMRAPALRGTSLAIGLGSLAPDIDLVLVPAGWDRYLVAHQAGTHSLLGAIVCGVLAAGVAHLLRRGSALRPLIVPAVVGAVSHVLADLLSGATIRIAWPMLDTRVSNLGVFTMGDPLTIAVFAIGGLLMLVWRQRRRHCAITILATVAALVFVKTVSRERRETAYREHHTFAGSSYLIEPIAGSFTTWRVVDGGADYVRAVTIDTSGIPDLEVNVRRAPYDGTIRALVESSRDWENVRNFLRTHDFTFADAYPNRPAGTSVMWSDVRYCSPGAQTPLDCAVVVGGDVDQSGQVQLFVRVGEWTQYRR